MVQWRAMVSREQLVDVVESGINELIRTFQKNPYFFYSENDLHCYLYHEIYGKLVHGDWQCKTRDAKTSVLLHKEYPTKQRHSAKELKEGVPGGARGHFDLSIWNPSKTEERLFRVRQSTDFEKEQQTFIAIEFDLIEGSNGLDSAVHHLRWDLLKLRSAKNEIEQGYLLAFVRDWVHSNKFLEEIRGEVAKEQDIVILYVEKWGGRKRVGTLSLKPFLSYESLF